VRRFSVFKKIKNMIALVEVLRVLAMAVKAAFHISDSSMPTNEHQRCLEERCPKPR
jgi:hypothetical protein